MKINKKRMTVTLALTAGLTYTSVSPSITYASPSLGQLNQQKASQQSLQAQLNAQQQALQKDLDKVNKKQLALTSEISDTQAEINENNDSISALKEEIKVINKRIEDRKALLKDRLVSIYKNGGSVNYLEVLLGSKNFGDFIDRTKALYTITTQDQKIITEQKNDQASVKEKKATVEKKQATNVAKLEKLKKNLAEVESLQSQKKLAVDALQGKQSDVSKKISQLVDAAKTLKSASENVSQVSYTPASSKSNSVSSASSSSASSFKSSKSAAQPFTLSASVASGGVSGILNYGNKFIGRSTYDFGASDPSTGRFDCSGFVHAAFAANGIGVGRSTSALVNTGRAVSYSEAKPGDLVFFDTYKTNGHVGIYLGGGRFIGSQSSTGVAIVSMSNSYWHSHFRGVVRRVLD